MPAASEWQGRGLERETTRKTQEAQEPTPVQARTGNHRRRGWLPARTGLVATGLQLCANMPASHSFQKCLGHNFNVIICQKRSFLDSKLTDIPRMVVLDASQQVSFCTFIPSSFCFLLSRRTSAFSRTAFSVLRPPHTCNAGQVTVTLKYPVSI